MRNSSRYDERYIVDLWVHVCYSKLKLENKIELKNSKTGKSVALSNTTHGQNTSENHFLAWKPLVGS